MKLESMTKKDLVALAKEHEIKRRTLMTKPELIKAIQSVMKKSGLKKLKKKAPVKGYETTAAPQLKPKADVKAQIPDYYIAPYYDQDVLFFLPVAPGEEYAYWEMSLSTQDRFKKEFGVSECNFELRIHCDDRGEEQQLEHQQVSARGDRYFGLWAPLKKLWAEIGAWDREGRFHTVMKSPPVVMPSDVVSGNIDMKWMTVTDSWETIYKLSGVDETRDGGGASMPDHIVRRVREYIESSFKGTDRS